jgi:mersacidin/lichenicidin family type 2 lantibiotic
MSNHDIIRAWKDPLFRKSLTDAQRAMLPDNPAGYVELTDDDLKFVAGATAETQPGCGSCTMGCPTIQDTCSLCTGLKFPPIDCCAK